MPLLWHQLRQKKLDDAVSFEAAESLREITENNPKQIS
jgi:hypothetical protein